MSVGATALRRPRLRRLRLRIGRRGVRLAVAAALVAALLLGGGWLLFRDSSLVAVEHVTITGNDGPDAAAIQVALEGAARKMTTLDAPISRLRASVARYPEVRSLRVSTQFPHGLVIHVIELRPVAVVEISGREVPVTGDGTLLARAPASRRLPLIALAEPPPGGRLETSSARAAARLLAAAPFRMLPRLAEVTTVSGHGLVAQIRGGPSIYFGDAGWALAKWTAVLAVLADPGSAGASYIDVTDPARPVAGSGREVVSTGGATATGGAVTTGATSGSGGTAGATGTSGTSGSAATATASAAAPSTAAGGG